MLSFSESLILTPLLLPPLQPSNILIGEDGAPVISDFGVSRVVATTMGSFGVTANKVGGTYNLESPEQLDGEDDEGNPLRAHLPAHAVTPFTPAHFERWLELFSGTVDEDSDDVLAQLTKVQAIVRHLDGFPPERANAACRPMSSSTMRR